MFQFTEPLTQIYSHPYIHTYTHTHRFIDAVRDNSDRIETCKKFQFTEPDTGKDQGLNVREKAKVLLELLEVCIYLCMCMCMYVRDAGEKTRIST
jgi:hypothetical protein